MELAQLEISKPVLVERFQDGIPVLANSISFFENSVGFLLERSGTGHGAAGLREKFEWMYTRIRSAQARELARPLYEEALGRL